MIDLLNELTSRWDEVIRVCDRGSRDAAALLHVVHPVELFQTGATTFVTLETRYPFHRDRMLERSTRFAIQNAIENILVTQPIVIDVRLIGEAEGKAATTHTTRSVIRRAKPTRSGNTSFHSIPTEYRSSTNGQTFYMRSRLEASTATILDSAGIEWMYEPEGFDLRGVWYLPDFWLPENRLFLEVKGILDKRSEEKVIRLAQACSDSDIQVMLLHNVRPRVVGTLRYAFVVGHVVTQDSIIKDSIALMRCPHCNRGMWKPIIALACPLCHNVQANIHSYLPIGGI